MTENRNRPASDQFGFVQKQVPDRRRISNKMTLTLTLSRPTGFVFSVVGTSRCDVRAACSGATPSNAIVARIFIPPATTRAGTVQRAVPTIALNTYPTGEGTARPVFARVLMSAAMGRLLLHRANSVALLHQICRGRRRAFATGSSLRPLCIGNSTQRLNRPLHDRQVFCGRAHHEDAGKVVVEKGLARQVHVDAQLCQQSLEGDLNLPLLPGFA